MVPGVDPVVALTYRATVDAQAAEGDARGLAVVRPAARAAIAWDLIDEDRVDDAAHLDHCDFIAALDCSSVGPGRLPI